MTRFEIANYAQLLPELERDRFAHFARTQPYDRVRGFVRYRLQMRSRGFKPSAVPYR